MKLSRSLPLAILFATIVSSCNSSTSSTPNNNNNNTISTGMTVSINGTAWTGQVVGFRHAGPLKNCQFEGYTNAPTQQLSIGISPSINTTGSYSLVDSTNGTSASAIAISYVKMPDAYSDVISGTITITTFTETNIQGTFNCKIYGSHSGDTVTLSNGKFNVPLS